MRSRNKLLSAIMLILGLSSFHLLGSQKTSDEVKRNQILVSLLNKSTHNRERVVKYLPRGDEQIPLLVSLPLGKKLQHLPILYVTLDGDPKSVSGLEFAHIGRRESNVVFVGMPSSSRIRDYTSPLSPHEKKPFGRMLQSLTDTDPFKGDEFAHYIAQVIVPFLEKEYGPFSIKILVGGSLGGTATLDVFASHPDSFDAYGVFSPSLWYNFDYFQKKIEALSKTPARLKNKCLLLTASEDEPEIFASTRQADKLLQGLKWPSSFRFQFKRLFELEHVPAIRAAALLIPSFVFNSSTMITSSELENLSFDDFQKKLQEAVEHKTCFSRPTVSILLPAYLKYGTNLAKEKRYDEAFELYGKVKESAPDEILSLLSQDAFISSIFGNLTKPQKDTLAKDYIKSYIEILAEAPQYAVHQANFDLVRYIHDNNIGPLPHSLRRQQ